ncbi:MAG: hypothetical protein C4311_06135 [Chloroflexota bacterium]
MMPSKHIAYYNLREALARSAASAQQPCPLCDLATKAVASYLDSLLYESVNDPGLRQDIREARGLCNEHAWQLQTLSGGALSIALIYRDVLETVLQLIRQGKYRRSQPFLLQRLPGALGGEQPLAGTADLVAVLVPQRACPACRHQHAAEDVYLSTLIEALDDEDMCSAFRASSGLCLPHFRRAVQLAGSEAAFNRLMELEITCLERLDADLNEFIRKQDYRFAHEPMGQEGNAWRRAIGQMSAQKGIR